MTVVQIQTVRLLLDVDGVLNAVGATEGKPWPEWKRIQATAGNGFYFRITYAEEVIEFLRELHESGLVQVIWLTTWVDHAATALAPVIGLPEFEVAGRPEIEELEWWKLSLARQMWEEDHTPFIWIDDDLYFDSDAQEWLATLPADSFLAISPDSRAGISPHHIDKIKEWLAQR